MRSARSAAPTIGGTTVRLAGCEYYSENAALKSSAAICADAVGVFRQQEILLSAARHRRDERWSKRSGEAGEPTGAREHVCGPGVILTTSVKGAREGARVKIMPYPPKERSD